MARPSATMALTRLDDASGDPWLCLVTPNGKHGNSLNLHECRVGHQVASLTSK